MQIFFIEWAVFAGKAFCVVFGIIVVLVTLAVLIAKSKSPKPQIKITHLNKKLENYKNLLVEEIFSKSELKAYEKEIKTRQKSKKKEDTKPNVFVLNFNGDIKASEVKGLRTEVSALLELPPEKIKEVVIKLESPGGMVHGYGLAAAQLLRIKTKGIPLTVCVDKVAASGGYMMACIADKIISAPFAILGSIGVIAQVPNLNRLLKKNNIDYEEITAGEYKRTISIFGEITEKGRKKFVEDINDTHVLFKDWVSNLRPKLNISEVATGEHWFGQRALEKNLADTIMTSDEYLQSLAKDYPIYELSIKTKQTMQQKLTSAAGHIISKKIPDWIMEWQNRQFF